jgi:FkbM family methyltransferase
VTRPDHEEAVLVRDRRESLTGRRGLRANLQRLRLIRRAFKGWLLPAALVPVGRVLASSRLLAPLPRAFAHTTVTLRLRHEGTTLKTPLLDAWPAFEVFAFHEYAFQAIDWGSIKTVIDCGAHVGAFALWVAARSPCTVTCVEPNPSTVHLLSENLSALKERGRVLQLAVAGESGSRSLHDAGFAATSSFVRRWSSATIHTVTAVTLEELIARSGYDRVDLLKMDVEGAEQEIFASVQTPTLEKIGTAIIECHPFAGTEASKIAGQLEQAGMHVIHEPYLILATRPR